MDYTEQLSHWPHLINYNKAHIAAKTTGSSAHLIESKHSTCFLGGLYCRECDDPIDRRTIMR